MIVTFPAFSVGWQMDRRVAFFRTGMESVEEKNARQSRVRSLNGKRFFSRGEAGRQRAVGHSVHQRFRLEINYETLGNKE